MRYLILTVKHKWFVLVAGLYVGVPLRQLLRHDWTKLKPTNFRAYHRQFFGKADRPVEFAYTWLEHQNLERHHWEFWICRTGHNRADPPIPDGSCLPMPDRYVREMIADWLAAGRAYEGKWPALPDWPWYAANWPKIEPRVHPETAARVQTLVALLPTLWDRPLWNLVFARPR